MEEKILIQGSKQAIVALTWIAWLIFSINVHENHPAVNSYDDFRQWP